MLGGRHRQVLSRVLPLIVLAAALLAPAAAHAKSYSVPRVDVQAVVEPDGSMLVTEQRTFRFDGD
jgi:hypothetical protein